MKGTNRAQSFDDRLLKQMKRYEQYGSSAQTIERLEKLMRQA